MNAEGTYLPPMLIFQRKRMADKLKNGAPSGTVFEVQDKGWMDTTLFKKWLEHFIQRVEPSPDEPVLLILNGHGSYVNSLEAVDFVRNSDVIMISLLTHCSHRMQPLDLCYSKPLKLYYQFIK
ncbi:hypothetical protein RRG08_007525 [Elysia crispata]|uniref:DDE-1 domain-containing protein n=1 Tax=Elysia crispata TaxID=231223 RepID=A0AAE1AL48_9GAST|nr:hypothetical protein RRG08_007525 [Elysia crispata]